MVFFRSLRSKHSKQSENNIPISNTNQKLKFVTQCYRSLTRPTYSTDEYCLFQRFSPLVVGVSTSHFRPIKLAYLLPLIFPNTCLFSAIFIFSVPTLNFVGNIPKDVPSKF